MNESEAILKIKEMKDIINENTESIIYHQSIVSKYKKTILQSKKNIVLLNNHIRNLNIRNEGEELLNSGMDEFFVWSKLSFKYGLSKSTVRGIYFKIKKIKL